LQGTNQEITMQ